MEWSSVMPNPPLDISILGLRIVSRPDDPARQLTIYSEIERNDWVPYSDSIEDRLAPDTTVYTSLDRLARWMASAHGDQVVGYYPFEYLNKLATALMRMIK